MKEITLNKLSFNFNFYFNYRFKLQKEIIKVVEYFLVEDFE